MSHILRIKGVTLNLLIKMWASAQWFQDIFNQAHTSGPITREQVKLITYKDATQLALIL